MIMGCQGGNTSYPTDVQETYEEFSDGTKVFKDITYTSSYPNNTYTVYQVPNSKGVFFYIHGGGLVGGDSVGGMLSGLFAAIKTNPDYAGKIDINFACDGGFKLQWSLLFMIARII